MKRTLNIVVPLAGRGTPFKEAGYAFPKALIDIKGKTMIELVVGNLKPTCEHRFIFICQREHYEKFDLYNIFKNVTDNKFEVVQLNGQTEGAACTVLTATEHINNDNDLLIANSDQFIETGTNNFIKEGRRGEKDGLIMTFEASHPKWSYARTDSSGRVIEVAEKKVISKHATVGIYYFRKGTDFVDAAQAMIHKNIRYNNEFYICPAYNEMILSGKKIFIKEIPAKKMHGLGTPEDLSHFLKKLESGKIKI
ncbi:MAG: Nucleotidyl transferase [Parcubacteria group bacterium GW2011_GWA2_47_16]|nr:MAG: Nucleotidyl transferase [Parcubacteria group bacterium GW2011_GWA2_47_16]